MSEHDCIKEKQWGELTVMLQVLKEGLERIECKVGTHILEGEKEGGFRDRLLLVELAVKELRRRFWLSAGVGGLIGALIGAGATDILRIFLTWIMSK
jgi:hypothetical protein